MQIGNSDAHNGGALPGAAAVAFDRIQALTFDCYGTLIDWETGLLNALRAILRGHGQNLTDKQILEIYGELEPAAQNPYQRYRQVLMAVAKGFGERLGFDVSNAEAESSPDSLKSWQPFPDTVAALAKLKNRYKLAIISNVDDDLFAATAPQLKIKFDEIVTAEQAQAYKPSEAPFRLALQRLRVPPDGVLHAGQSIFHDVLPAKSLGFATALVYRRGFGATRPVEGEPDITVPDLESLAALALGASAAQM
jgi:2-haloacid dehalogenase